MSTSGSELEDNLLDNDIEDNAFNDMMDNINDGLGDSDDFCDFEDTGHMTSLWNAIIKETAPGLLQVPSADIPSDYSVCLAMNSEHHPSMNLSSSVPFIDDSLRMYLVAPPLIKKTVNAGKNCLSIDPTINDSKTNSLSTSQLYVGNLPYDAKSFELKNWFDGLGYGVTRVDLNNNKRGARFAIVRFASIATATDVLYKSESNSMSFVFRGHALDIKRRTRSKQKTPDIPKIIAAMNNVSKTVHFNITDIHYGTLITGGAMRNIQRKNSIISNNDEFGIIAHNLISSDFQPAFNLSIDTEKKKLAIISEIDYFVTSFSDSSNSLKFEWNFRDLKARKITPVLINQNDVFLLIEVKRSPIILETQSVDCMGYDTTNETRLPGNPLIGHANVWLFKLSSNDLSHDYKKLFDILYRQNLTQRQFYGDSVVHLIGTPQMARRNLESVQLISNDQWVRQNQALVDDFFLRRWPSYPFETKFEIMKLISKHVITVNDLIVDEQAEDVLKSCTINTLTSLTDQIVELAARWFPMTCDNEEEDWDTETEQEQQAEPEQDSVPTVVEDVPTTTMTPSISSHIRLTATGASVNIAKTEIVPLTTTMGRLSLTAKNQRLGTFSRLLISALEQLLKKNQLYRTTNSKVYATKLELRTANENPFFIRKIYITPSTILYEGPYREETCAITRTYIAHQDRFLRVTFRDEDYRILHDYNDNMSKMYERIKNILINGVNVCDRHYQFLAFSSSQLREHSCWMFASINKYITVDTIRDSMGDFRNVYPVAKYAARLGQSFSTSIKGIKLENREFREISDREEKKIINGRERTLCFTDGIGIISPKLAKKLAEEMKLSDKNSCPSAFQIRCGGYKGMVCSDVFNCITHPDVNVYFRKSMNKFIAKNFSIDVVRTSLNPAVAYLNRQIILLLSSLGIPNQTFISLQDKMVHQLKALIGNAQEACRALRDLNEFGGNGFHTFLIAYLKKLGEQRDPFVRRLLLAFKAFLIKELRTKAKIRVQDSWSLLGVVDESRKLKYGQVFIQIDNSNQQRENPTREIFQGPVVVTRNPCFHPGDVRKLEAVDIPSFHNLKNVIVFPMTGPRPHAMEMSGGDLDGDTFWISRHPDLIFPLEEEPFDYQDQEDEAKDAQGQHTGPYNIKDVCNFFGEYIAADNLGLIANSHLVFADQSPSGAMDEKCLKLARMHSVAVDFAKNGVSAPQLTRELRPQEYPHYMEKGDKKMYHSDTILGVLYDKIQLYNTDFYIDEENEINATSTFPYTSFFINGIDNYMKDAHILKGEYDRDVKRVMRQYGIKNEAEVVSGYILKFTSKQYAKETKLFELTKEITHAYRVIQDKYLRLFWQEFYQFTGKPQDEEIKWSEVSKKLTWKYQLDAFERYNETGPIEEVKKKASAWFRVTYEPWLLYVKRYQKDKKNPHMARNNQQTGEHQYFKGLFSFAWIVYPVLLKIFIEQNNDNKESKKKKKKKKKDKSNDTSVASNNNK